MNNNNKKANSYWILWGAGGIGGCLGITNEIIKKKKLKDSSTPTTGI